MSDSRNPAEPHSHSEAWQVAVDLARLGVRALAEGRLEEALTRHQAAQRLFQQLHETQMEAAAWHQLGKVHHRLQHSEEAERHYREAARMCQEQGHHAAAAQTWNDLAELLQSQPGRLDDARQLAEHAVTAMQSLDPAAAEVWRGYGILGDIAETGGASHRGQRSPGRAGNGRARLSRGSAARPRALCGAR